MNTIEGVLFLASANNSRMRAAPLLNSVRKLLVPFAQRTHEGAKYYENGYKSYSETTSTIINA